MIADGIRDCISANALRLSTQTVYLQAAKACSNKIVQYYADYK